MADAPAPIDWEAEARAVGSCDGAGHQSGGDRVAAAFLARRLGETALRDAVRFYVTRGAGAPGTELARSVLIMLRPDCARDECARLYERGDDDVRTSAIELLRMVADETTLPLFDRVLRDGPPDARSWAAYGIRQLVYGGELAPLDAAEWADRLLADADPNVRHQGGYLAGQLLGAVDATNDRLERWLGAMAGLDETLEDTRAEIRRRLG